MYERKFFSDAFRLMLASNKINTVQLAAKLGLKKATVSAWITEKAYPHMETLVTIADFFNVPLDFFFARGVYAHWGWLRDHQDLVCQAISDAYCTPDGKSLFAPHEYVNFVQRHISEVRISEGETHTVVTLRGQATRFVLFRHTEEGTKVDDMDLGSGLRGEKADSYAVSSLLRLARALPESEQAKVLEYTEMLWHRNQTTGGEGK